MKETPLNKCTYNVQAFPEDDPHKCGKRAIKLANSQRLHMYYCKKHWTIAKEMASEIAEITDV